eukprot:828887-Rhodomonas_salina.1
MGCRKQVAGKGPPTLDESLAGCEDGKKRERVRNEHGGRLSGVWAEAEMAAMQARRGDADVTWRHASARADAGAWWGGPGGVEVIDGGPATQQEGRGKLKDALVEYEGRELEDKEVGAEGVCAGCGLACAC